MLVTAGIAVGFVAAPAEAAIPLDLTATSTPSILAGQPGSITLTAGNTGAVDFFNASFRYVLPAGVTYAGPTTGPDGVAVAAPTVITITDSPTATHQVLVFGNVADLPQGLDYAITFAVASALPVGSSFGGTADVFTNTNARLVPKFSATGVASNYVNTTTAPTSPKTVVSAIKVTKSEPSPEHELMRGVHDHQTTYTILTENTTQGATTGVVIVDYLPAGLEFLGCAGDGDNSATVSAEYPESGPLATTAGGANCRVPVSVETIDNRTDAAGTPIPGVFTKVTWNIGDLAAGASNTLTYAAAIPLNQNQRFTGTAPSIASGDQGSNLDNNTGPSTRQVTTGLGLKNDAVGTGTYQGPVVSAADRATTSTGSVTVKAMDLSIVKSVADPNFATNGTAQFSLLVRASEYADNSSMTIVDTLPDGLCPMVPNIVNNSGSPLPAGCVAATVSNATVNSTTANPDGTFTLTLTPDPTTIGANQQSIITYSAFQGTTYRGDGDNDPVVAGDSFVNSVDITGTTSDITTVDGGVLTSPKDDSSATLVSGSPSIDKTVLPRPTPVAGTPVDCATATGYSNTITPTYYLGDKICFALTVNFSTATDTRNARITDLVPVGTSYDGWSVAPSNTVTVTAVTGTQAVDPASTVPAAWDLGDLGSPGNRFVAKGSTITLYVSAIVTDPATTAAAVDITANLMKYREVSTKNVVLALRDSADFGIAPAPTVALTKGVTAVTTAGSTVSYNPASANPQVREGDVVTFALDLSNTGAVSAGNAVDVDNVQVWDALPVGFTCVGWNVQVVGATCVDPGATGYPVNSALPAGTPRSIILWTFTDAVAAGAHHAPVTYTVTVPAQVSVSSIFRNDVSVVAFTSPNTAGGDTGFFPKGSLDPRHDTDGNTTPANANASIHLPDAVAVKSGVTSITGTNNNSLTQAVPGETITYTYGVTVPAGTTVFNATLTDPLPTGLTLPVSPVFTATQDAHALPSGVTVDPATGALSFGPSYNNATGVAQVFTVVIPGVKVGVALAQNVTLTNTANFTSTATASTSSTKLSQNKSYAVTVVNPLPTIAKTPVTSTAKGGDTVVFTLSLRNTAGRPDAFDAVVTDCLPAGLIFTAFLTAPAGQTPTSAVGGCNAGSGAGTGTLLTWNLTAALPIAPAAAATITYSATVDPTSTGLSTYRNTATVTTSSLANNSNDSSVESVQTASSSATVTVAGATTVKAVLPAKPTVGDTVSYTITVTVPPNENFYDASIIDTLPVGITYNTGSDLVTCAPVAQCNAVVSTRLTDGTPSASGQKIGWLLGRLAPSSATRTYTVTFTGTVGVAEATNTAGIVRTNQAYLAWNNSTLTTPPSRADATFQATGAAGTAAVTLTEPLLTIAKGVSNATPAPNDTFVYTVTVSNAAGATRSTAFNSVVTDVVPVGVIVDPASLSANGSLTGAVATGGGTITWSPIAPIAAGGSVSFTYSARLAVSTSLTAVALINSADVPSYASLTTGGRSYDNVATATAPVTPKFPNVSLGKRVTGASTLAYVDTPMNFTLSLTNALGAAPAATVVGTDVLPANWTFDAGSARITRGRTTTTIVPTVTTSGGVQTLVFPSVTNVLAGEVVTITYDASPTTLAASTSPGAGNTIGGTPIPHVNTLTAVTTDATGATGRGGATSYTGPQATATAHIDLADLTIVKSAGDPLVAGSTVANAWNIVVTNSGPNQAVGTSISPFTVIDTPGPLPAGVTITGASGTGWACAAPTGGSISCTRTGTLDNGLSFPVIHVSASVADDAIEGAEATNSASVDGLTYDPTDSENSSSAAVVTRSDVSITKAISGIPHAGEATSWTIGVVNNGPSDATSVSVTDTLPTAGLTGATATGVGWTCGTVTTTVTCTADGALPVGPAPSITVSGNIPSSFTGTLSNSATVSAHNDGNPDNNTASTAAATVGTGTVLTLAKTLVGPIVPGANAQYRFVVTNTGTADATGLTLTDPLPGGLSYVAGSAVSTDGWACNGTTTVSCVLTGSLAAAPGRNTSTLTISARVPQVPTGSLDNTATVTSDNAPDVSDTLAADATTPLANFSIVKSHPSGAVRAGDDVVYTLKATNLGPSDSPGPIVVTDTLPVGLSVAAVDGGSTWSCPVTGDASSGFIVTCSRSIRLDAGVTAPDILITATVSPNAGPATLTNTAAVSGPLPTTDTSLATTTDPTEIVDVSAVSITKTATSGPTVRAGENVTYSLTVHNDGPSTADSLTVDDVLPAGMTAVSIAGSGWTCSTPSFHCSIGSLAPGDSVLTVVATVAPSVPDGTTLDNIATVDWIEGVTPQTDSDTASVVVGASADLALVKTAVSDSATAGQTTDYLLTVSNLGPSDAVGPLEVVDSLPVGLTFVSATDWACSAAAATVLGQKVTCDLAAGLAVGATATVLRLTVLVDPALADGVVTNSADIHSATIDPNPDNDQDSAQVTVGSSADLSVVKSHSGDGVIGEPTAFTIAVTNAGPSVATAVSVVDTLPRGLSFLDADGSDVAWTCTAGSTDPTSGTTPVSCALTGSLAARAIAPTLVLRATVNVAAYPSVDNVATVSSAILDPDESNNTSTDSLDVDPLVGLSLAKAHIGQITVGQNAEYLLTVRNAGPTEDPGGFTVVDTLPTPLGFVSASGTGVTCVAVGQKVTCTFADALPVDASRAVTLTVSVADGAYPTVTNTATVASAFADGSPVGDRSASDVASVNAAPIVIAIGSLAFTGAQVNVALAAIIILLLLAIGAALVVVGRRRRREELGS